MATTIPALQHWTEEIGTCMVRRWVISAPEVLDPAVDLLLEELHLLGIPAGREGEPNLVVELEESLDEDLGAEGFRLRVGHSLVEVAAAAPAGARHGLRAVSQLLRQGELPMGETLERPRYAERGVTLCASQINIQPAWIDRLLTDMADLRMNQLLLELKLRTDDERQNFWSVHERDTVRALVERAAGLGIDVVPEINSPGHMGVWLHHRPDLQLRDNEGKRQPVQLDLSHPEAFDFYTHLVDQYLEVFDSSYWHMGGDEYMIHTSFANYDALTAWAKRTYGEDATIADAHVAFINRVNDHVKARGKVLRIWNDGIVDTKVVQLDRDIVVDHWYGDGLPAAELVERGYTLTNVHCDLYFSRSHQPFKVDCRKLWDAGWHVGQFDRSEIDADHPQLLGLRTSIWPDESFRQTEQEVEAEIFEALRFTAQMAWHGSHAGFRTFDAFRDAALRIGHSPARANVPPCQLADGEVVIRRDGRFLGVHEGEVALVDEAQPWRLIATPDGYHQLVHGRDALTLIEGAKFLGVVTQAGARPTLAAPAPMRDRSYATSDHRNPQQWQLVPVDGGHRIRHALSNADLTVVTGKERSIEFSARPDTDPELEDQSLRPAPGTVAQLPPAMATGVWTIVPAAH